MTNAQILVVEDEFVIAMELEDRLKGLGYDVLAVVDSGEKAIQKASKLRPDLVLMDIMLKGEMDGVEAADQIQTRFDIPVIYLTAYASEHILQRAKITAPLGYLIKPFEEKSLHTTIEMALYRHQMEQKLKQYQDHLEELVVERTAELVKSNEQLQQVHVELAQAYRETLAGWARALELRDKETEGHSQRVTEMTVLLSKAMEMNGDELVHVRRGALLHDVGKMAVPDHILLKPTPLTDEEWTIMRQHPVHAYQMLSPIAYLRPALDIPYCHHERWDGEGYPRGLKGEQIPLAARVFAVVDVWDALHSNRHYRNAWSVEKIYAHIRKQAGRHFDPKVVEVFLQIMGEKHDR